MSFDMLEDPHSRDTALARLLAQALSRSKSDGAEQTSACPDAEILAAYAEHGLAEEETARCEGHFADCSRCQKIIAVLAASGDELTESEVVELGNLAAASPVNREPVARNAAWWTLIWRRPALWRWLVPAAALASAAGLWLALHQAPPRETLSAQKNPAAIETPQTGAPQTGAQKTGAAPPATGSASAKPDETQIAQAKLPPPPAASPRSEAALRDKEAAPAESSARAKKEQAQKQETFSNAIGARRNSENDRALESREDAAKDSRLQSAQPDDQKSDEKKSPMSDVLSEAAPAAPVASPPPAPPPPRELDRAQRQATDRATGAPAATQLKALAQAVSPAIVFASPARRVLWRLASGGRIERSTDQGQTWQAQSSGATADLLAGAAPSETVAWVVGRNGIILRTEDGEDWQRIPLPAAVQSAALTTPAPDWVGVEARDALHATIMSRDLRRFATEDGGRTWNPVQ